jgi:hypothetical protein
VGRPLTAQADETESWYCYAPEGAAQPVPYPNESSTFNCILPENSGGYVAVWDDATNSLVILEHRSATGVQTWTNTLFLATNENTRVVLASTNRVLWCSAQRWVFLNRDTGAIVATAAWDHPLLDPNKIIIRDRYDVGLGKDILHVINSGTATAYLFDTNMTARGSCLAAPPQGLWASFAGTWLIDLSNRTNHSIRVALLTDLDNPRDIPLPTTLDGGYTENRVLSADTNTMYVLSSINWPTITLHYLTLFNGDGIIFQNRMSCRESFTGVTAMPNGWLLSARTIGATVAEHYLFRVDTDGGVNPQLRIYPSAPQNYIALNTDPPRVLHVIDAAHSEIFTVTSEPWWHWWLDGSVFLTPNVEVLRSSEHDAPIGSTSSFWLTPICPNTK